MNFIKKTFSQNQLREQNLSMKEHPLSTQKNC